MKPNKPIKPKPAPMSTSTSLQRLRHDLARVEVRVKRSDGRLRYIERQLLLVLNVLKNQGNPVQLQEIVDQLKVVSEVNSEETTKINNALEAQKEVPNG